jgi:hypothetical protein
MVRSRGAKILGRPHRSVLGTPADANLRSAARGTRTSVDRRAIYLVKLLTLEHQKHCGTRQRASLPIRVAGIFFP